MLIAKNQNQLYIQFWFSFLLPVFFFSFSDRKSVVKNVVPQTLSPPGSTPWKQQGPPSPSSASSDSSPAYSPSRTLDLSGSSTSFSSDRVKMSTHQWKSGPVEQWNNEQVIERPFLFSKFKLNTISIISIGMSLALRY